MNEPTTPTPATADERAAAVVDETPGAVLDLTPVPVGLLIGLLVAAGHAPDLVTSVTITARAAVIVAFDSADDTLPRTSSVHVHPIERP